MECDIFHASQMRRPQLPILRSFVSTLYPVPRTCLIFLQKDVPQSNFPKPLFLSPGFHSVYTCAANAIDTIDSESRLNSSRQNYSENPYSFGSRKPLKRIHRKDVKFTSTRSSDKVISGNKLSFNAKRGSFSGQDLKFREKSVGEPGGGGKTVIFGGNKWTSYDRGSIIRVQRSSCEVDRGKFVHIDKKQRLIRYSKVLGSLAINLQLNQGKAIHGEIIKNGTEPDAHLSVSLINFYAKCGDLDSSRKAFDEIVEKDVVSWTALISGFVAKGRGSESVELLCEMRRENVRPNEFTLATVLKGCSMCLDLGFGKQLHTEVIKAGLISDIYVGSALVDLYSKCSVMEYANSVFVLMPEQSAVSWNALLNGYAEVGDGEEVLRLFCRMTESEMRFSNYTLSTVLKGCASSRDAKAGQVVHSMTIKIGGEVDDFISCSLVDMYSKCGLVEDALTVFKMIKDPDVVAWSAMISGLDQKGKKQEALELFQLMRHSGLQPNEFTLTSVISAATDLDDILYCKSIHALICKHNFESEAVISNALIEMYMKYGAVYDGCHVFSAMRQRDVVAWNALLSGYHDDDTSDQGPKIFKQMLMEGLKPNIYTFVSILRSCSSSSNMSFAKQLHARLIKENLESDVYVGTALLDVYAKCKHLEDAELIFNRLIERDLFSWTVIITGYAQSGQGEKAVCFFRQMQREDVMPNEYTIAGCLRGCSAVASLGNGRQLHSLAIKCGHFGDAFVVSALVDMYSKCGCLDDAETLFDGKESFDTVLWNTMICGYSQHGQGEKALEAFQTMLDVGALPDRVTFIGVLSACSHMGSIEQGEKHFNSMSEVYGLTPSIEHYGCMVDLLGRAGKFDELWSFIEKMNQTPNAMIWQTVLGACKVHGNVKLAERAAEKLFEMEPEADANYILLSNIYASKRMWEDVSRIRALMSSRGIKKEPGCSWVEVDAQMHIFVSQDASHPRIREVYRKLEELVQRVILAGYIPNTNYVLQNVPEREKRENLLHHSERLALAFALIHDNSNQQIRIFKNLCICGDCHEFMKCVSAAISREIVIRDVNRFHHFQGGACSCKDYW